MVVRQLYQIISKIELFKRKAKGEKNMERQKNAETTSAEILYENPL